MQDLKKHNWLFTLHGNQKVQKKLNKQTLNFVQNIL